MKIGKKLGLLFITIFIFLFKIDLVNAEEINCTYEMYPVNYYIDNNYTPQSIGADRADLVSAKTKFEIISNKKYELRHIRTLDGKNKKFNDAKFADKVVNDGKCPAYVKVKIKANDTIDAISSSEFTKMQNSFLIDSKSAKKEYPMFLVEQNGQSIKNYAGFSATLALDSWSKIIKSNPGVKVREVAKQYYESIYANTQLYEELMVNNPNWRTFSNYALGGDNELEEERNLNNLEVDYSQAKKDYCYYYCSDVVCKNMNNTAQTECTKACEKDKEPKCNNAYNACTDKTSTEKEACIKNEFIKNGLDTSYLEIRNQKMNELSEEIEKLKKIVDTAKASKINIEVGVHPYKLTCDDVVIFHEIWVILIIISPVLVIIMGTLDFGQAVIASSEDKIQKAWKKFPKRVFALVILILVPMLISLLLSLATDEGARDTSLMYCIINGGDSK